MLIKNPVELLLIAQKDKAPAKAKEYWTLALTAIDVMLHDRVHGPLRHLHQPDRLRIRRSPLVGQRLRFELSKLPTDRLDSSNLSLWNVGDCANASRKAKKILMPARC